ncbi:MAG TPA: hypothetical protein VGK73_05120 [Polyangiaceae bacterium]
MSTLLAAASGAAREADAAPSLVWRAPPECISAAELDRAVSAELRRPAFAAGASGELVVAGHIDHTTAGTYRAEVALTRASGETVGVRSLSSDNRDCRSLDEALAVMLAIMLNVSQAERPAPERSALSYRLALGGAVTLGRLPGPGIEATLSGGPWLRDRLGFELELGFETGPAERHDEGSVKARAFGARFALAPVLLRGNPTLELHLSGGGGAMQAQASGFAFSRRETLGFAEIRGGPRLALRLGGALCFEISGDFGVMPARPRFLVQNADGSSEELFRPAPVFGALGLGLSLRPR